MNRLYRPLDEKAHKYIAEMTKLHGGFKIESGFYNGHYHRNSEGNYQSDSYPIPVNESGENVLKLLRKLKKYGFYY